MSMPRNTFSDWSSPPAIYRGAPFWSWNSKLDPQRLCRAIDAMHQAGMGGFFMHSRYGLKTPYLSDEWWQCISACVDKARELDMKAYLYDEDRWPSGFAGGLVTRDHEEFRMRLLYACEVDQRPENARPVADFDVEFDSQGRVVSYRMLSGADDKPKHKRIGFDVRISQPNVWFNDAWYPDLLNRDAVAEFISITHEQYAQRYGEDFGQLIPAIFTDEPGCRFNLDASTHPSMPWTSDFAEQFRTRRGYDLPPHLPAVFYRTDREQFSKVRHDYLQTVGELFTEAFTAQTGQWCDQKHIALTGHLMLEWPLAGQCQYAGSAMPHYEHMQWPGVDILMDRLDEVITVKQCSSVASQLGRERVLSEVYGCTGWDWPLEGHKHAGDWQYVLGVNFRCPHLTHYSLAGGAKRDYPASIFSHSPWWKYYQRIEDYFARLGLMLTQGVAVRDVLVLHPIDSVWGCHDGKTLTALAVGLDTVTRALLGQHYDCDLGDESLMARHARVDEGRFSVGQMAYKLVVVPPTVTLRSSTVKLLEDFIDGGGKVLFIGQTPDHVDAEPNDRVAALIKRAQTCSREAEQFVPAIEDALPRRVSVREGNEELQCVWTMLRSVEDGQVLFVQSNDRKEPHCVDVSVLGVGPVVLWDLLGGKKRRLDCRQDDGQVNFALDLSPTGSALVSIGMDVPDAAEVATSQNTVAESKPIAGPWDIELTEPNTLPLDYCRMKFGDATEFSQPMPVLKAEAEIRKQFGLGKRLGREQQPWYLQETGAEDTAERGPCQLKWSFHVTDMPSRCALAIERPGDYRIEINGTPASPESGYWVDEDIRTIEIADLLVAGDNEILLSFTYRTNMEIEDLYLVGDFSVSSLSDAPPAPGNHTLAAMPAGLAAGSWVSQGLDFYGGSVLYKMKLDRPSDLGNRRIRLRLPALACTAAAIHVNSEEFVLPWAPFEADITDALVDGTNEIAVEVIGGRKNILGPLHTPWEQWTGPGEFDPDNDKWRLEYYLTDHGLMGPAVLDVLE